MGVTPPAEEKIVSERNYPPGWDAERVREVLERCEKQTDEEAMAEDEAAYEDPRHAMMAVPIELVPVVRELIVRHHA